MKKILIVDDNRAMLRLYQFHFRQKGWEGLFFSDGPTALKALEETRPDLAILDYDLQGMLGTEIYEALRRNDPDHAIPVIFITGQIHAGIKKELRDLPGATVLNKPFSPVRLVREIEVLLG